MYFINSRNDKPNSEWFIGYIKNKCKDGIRVSTDIENYGMVKEVEKLKNEAASVLQNEYGIKNPNSSEQVREFISKCMDNPLVEMYCVDESGKISSRADNLQALAFYNINWAIQILKYRNNNGLLTGIKAILENVGTDGKIHPEVSIQKTNRISYSKPALMNIDKRILWSIIQPKKSGNYLWSVDIKNQEPWILAHVTNDEELNRIIDSCYKNGESFYRSVYKEVFGNVEIHDAAYAELKTTWNSLTYGASLKMLNKTCRLIDAYAVYKYFNSLQGLKEYRKNVYAHASKGITVCRTLFGSRLYAGDLDGSKLKRTLLDLPIQGTGADILALIVKHFEEEKVNRGITDEIDLYFTRHDEVIFEVSNKWQDAVGREAVAEELRDIMEHQINNWLPFGLEVKLLNGG